jgi:hypothetical protein
MTSSSDRPAFVETIEVLPLRYLKPIAMPGKEPDDQPAVLSKGSDL